MPDGGERASTSTTSRGGGATIASNDEVFVWRFSILCDAGYEAVDAATLALASGVDLHRAVDLLHAGCPPGTATRILL